MLSQGDLNSDRSSIRGHACERSRAPTVVSLLKSTSRISIPRTPEAHVRRSIRPERGASSCSQLDYEISDMRFSFMEASVSVKEQLTQRAEALQRMKKKEKRVSKSSLTDEFYASYLTVRSMPVHVFLANEPPEWVLPITSIDEDKLLRTLKVPGSERSLIEGVMPWHRSSYRGGVGASNSVMSAIVRLAANPPDKVGVWQLRTASWLIRLFPHGAPAEIELKIRSLCAECFAALDDHPLSLRHALAPRQDSASVVGI